MQLQEDLPLAVLGDSRNFPPVEMVVPVQGEAVAMAVLAFENQEELKVDFVRSGAD